MKRFTIILSGMFLLSISLQAYGAEKLLNYGFEDWTGNAETTPGYIFGTNYADYWSLHKSATEVVSSSGMWKPHSGNKFFYRQHYSGVNDATLGGGVGTINDHGNMGGSFSYGHNSSFRCNQLGKKIFIKFWFILNSGYLDFTAYACKFLRIYTDTDAIYAHIGGNGNIYIINWDDAGLYHFGSPISWPGGNPINDGEWHSFAMYIDLTGNENHRGTVKIWLDSDHNSNPTWQASDRHYMSATRFDHICLQQNFSAQNPVRSTVVGLDDIEIWNDMPDSTQIPDDEPVVDTVAPRAPDGVGVSVINN